MAKVSMQRSVGRVRAACTLGVLSSGAPPHQLNRRRYGAGTFKFGVPGLASGHIPQKHIGCAVTRQQTAQNVTSSCCELTLLGRRSGVKSFRSQGQNLVHGLPQILSFPLSIAQSMVRDTGVGYLDSDTEGLH